MASVTLAEAQSKLPELIAQLAPGEELVITRDERPVAKLVGTERLPSRSGFGAGKGQLVILSEDDDHLKDFAEYM